jgi:glycosyltransferase involved in cell wall biosynthesis
MGTYPPRECGIATFTKDITNAIDTRYSPALKTKILAMNKNGVNIYNYPEDVIAQINDEDIQEYIDVAKKINRINKIKLVCIQHEFGIFGGEYGSYLIAFLEIINKPAIITFHSVLPHPDDNLKRVVRTLSMKSECLVVMAEKGKDILRRQYGINTEIVVIPHGIPTIPFISSIREKVRMGFQDKIILSSFGMINRGKGYEHVIQALPNVVRQFPNLLYLIIGETHPVVRKEEGEQYRNYIEGLVKQLKLEKNVKFYNKYVTLEEIIRYLQATDIFICSNKEPNQITSGTLAYAVGAGRAVISTPFLHAKELITDDRGILTKFNDSKSFEQAIVTLLSNPQMKKKMEHNAYANTRHMTWHNVALSYNEIIKKHVNLSKSYGIKLPEIKLDHMINLTDDFGIIQFANNIQPVKSSGYTLDDNARALIVSCMYYNIFKDRSKLDLIDRYLNFKEFVQQEDGKMFDIVDYEKNINTETWSEDAQGRAIWALGYLLLTKGIPRKTKDKARNILNNALKNLKGIKSPRTASFTILGLYYYNEFKYLKRNIKMIKKLSDYLVSLYENCSTEDWCWFEEYLTYSNSRLPEALYYAYLATDDKKYLDVANKSLDFLQSVTFQNNVYSPIGQDGWYFKNGKKAYFDQQPVDTASMVQALLLANRITGKKRYFKDAINAFYWFLGKNHLNQVMYDESTGGCHDGLGKYTINLNQGAESTIAYLLARLSLHKHKVETHVG